jgi:hypothetical protein
MSDIEKKGPGRPAYEPTEKERRQVKTLSGMGIPDYEIAKVMQVSEPTLRKYFAHELDIGHIEANAQVAQSLFRQATHAEKPNVAATIFWLKCRAGWKEAEHAPLGKKEQRELDAQTAEQGTGWEDLLSPPGARVQ